MVDITIDFFNEAVFIEKEERNTSGTAISIYKLTFYTIVSNCDGDSVNNEVSKYCDLIKTFFIVVFTIIPNDTDYFSEMLE